MNGLSPAQLDEFGADAQAPLVGAIDFENMGLFDKIGHVMFDSPEQKRARGATPFVDRMKLGAPKGP